MILIDPDGLYNGERLRSCGIMARLYWPYIYGLHNSCGRFELDMDRIMARAFLTFDPMPSREDIASYIREYASNWLLFVYEDGGQMWGQWDIPKELMPRYQSKRDSNRSPEPPRIEFERWRDEYRMRRAVSNVSSKMPFSSLRTEISTHKMDESKEISAKALISAQKAPISTHQVVIGVVTDIETPKPPEGADEGPVREFAERIRGRHPKHRSCSLETVKGKLRTITGKMSAEKRLTTLERIDSQHVLWCKSAEWAKDGGAYVKGLAAWLNQRNQLWENMPQLCEVPLGGYARSQAAQRDEMLRLMKQQEELSKGRPHDVA